MPDVAIATWAANATSAVPIEGPEFLLTNDRAPRWWTTLAVLCVSGLTFVVASALMTALAFRLVHGELDTRMFSQPESMRAVLSSRIGLFTMVVVPQLMLVIPAIIAAYLSPVDTCQRLGLVRGQWPVWTWPAAAAATPLVGLMSSLIVGSFLRESDSLKMMTDVFRVHGEGGFVIPLALMIGATPAVCEELLFRGYVQTRLVQTSGPLVGIVVASVLFAAFHLDFVHIVAVLPLGLYLGWVSWRSGSLFPAMIGHFFNNVISVVAVVFASHADSGLLAIPGLLVSLAILSAGLLGIAVVVVASIVYGRPDSGLAMTAGEVAHHSDVLGSV